jgi:YidC/Oxa1 family membrane protein insertase
MREFFSTVFYEPIFNLLFGLYALIPGHDIGIAIILLTVIVKLILWPVSAKAMRSQKALAGMQPKVEELKKKYPGKEQKEELAKELMALYSKEKVSPASSCLPLLIQLPVFIALYQAMIHGLQSDGFDKLYGFIPNPGTIEPMFVGLLDLTKVSIPLALIAGLTQFFQAKMMVSTQQPKGVPGGKDEQLLSNMNKQMTYVMPVVTVMIGMQFPAGLTLYWVAMNLLTILQQWMFLKKSGGTPAASAIEPAA